MTIRLSIISLAGTARTLVAVGTSNDADMFFTTAAAAPRSTRVSSPSADGTGAAAFGLAGVAGDLCSVEAPLIAGGAFAGGGAVVGSLAGVGFGSGGAAGSAGCPPLVDALVSTDGSGE